MSDLTYAALIRELFPRLTGGIRWGLDRTRRMLADAGDPHLACPLIHVGGTNGKGSVAATMASALRRHGWRSGLYTSPHLCTFRERIQVDGAPISERDIVRAAELLWPSIQRETPSFFEATTAIAFLALKRAEVDVAVIEVGLGGRLDATNVIRPEVAVLTNVALDHVQFLGPTLESVATEKAGIIKAGVPVVTAETDPVPLEVFRRRAQETGASLDVLTEDRVRCVESDVTGSTLDVETGAWGRLRVHTPLPGPHQVVNTALAVAALDRLPDRLRPGREAVVTGVAEVNWPGRMQVERLQQRTWVFDVAHNLAGVHALASALRGLALPRPIVSVVGVLGDKDWRAMLGPIYAASDEIVLTLPPTAPADRRWEPAEVLREAPSAHASAVPAFNDALVTAWRRAGANGEGTILVTGSFHTVGDALIALGITPWGADADLPVPIFAA